jgi:hypothetical protein
VMSMCRESWAMASSSFQITTSRIHHVDITECWKLKSVSFE